MSLITIAQGLAKNVGMAVPAVVATSPNREWIEFLHIANQEGEELARRVDWGQLTKVATVTGVGAQEPLDLPEDFSRLVRGIAVVTAEGNARSLTRAEWQALEQAEGVPRYFLLEGVKISLWPYVANSSKVIVTYQSRDWCSNGNVWTADDDESLIDEELFLKGVIVRWRRQKGMDYADYEVEYEAALNDFARFNDRSRL